MNAEGTHFRPPPPSYSGVCINGPHKGRKYIRRDKTFVVHELDLQPDGFYKHTESVYVYIGSNRWYHNSSLSALT